MEQGVPKVIVGVDGSESSIEALRLAARIAPALGAHIEALACWDFPSIYAGYVPLGLDAFEQSMAKTLTQSLEKAFGEETPAILSASLARGPAASALIKASHGAAMLILGRRGHGGFRGLLLGSVSAACVSHAACPVLVVHEDQKGTAHEA